MSSTISYPLVVPFRTKRAAMAAARAATRFLDEHGNNRIIMIRGHLDFRGDFRGFSKVWAVEVAHDLATAYPGMLAVIAEHEARQKGGR